MAIPFDADRAATRAWQYCGPDTARFADPKKAAGKDIHYVYKGHCVGVLRRVWAACGIQIPGMDSCSNPSAYMAVLNRNPQFYKRVGMVALNNPRYGDVVLYHGGRTVGHGAIFLPIKGQGLWVSDAVQNHWNVYRSSSNPAHDIMVFRYVGDVQGDGGNAQFPTVQAGEGGEAGEYGDMVGNGGSVSLLDYCPNHIEFKGLWMRYHIWMGDRSPVMRNAQLNGYEMTGSAFTASAGECGISTEMLNQICQWETSHSFGYSMPARDLNGYDLGDAHGHRTFGYGLLTHPSGKYMDTIKSQWTQSELEQIYLTHIKQMSSKVRSWASGKSITLNQNQIDALVSACFNFGPGFLGYQTGRMVAANPNNPNIRDVWSHASDKQGRKYPGLIKRRQKEANWYFGYR